LEQDKRFTVLPVPFFDIPDIPDIYPTLDNIIVKLMPYRRGRKLRAWKFGKRMEVQAVNGRYRSSEQRETSYKPKVQLLKRKRCYIE
jgi:hypothetical protein